jgi:hypothetical protein
MKINDYGMELQSYQFDGKSKVEISVQFWKEFLGICTNTAYAFYQGTILPEGVIHWQEGSNLVSDGIEGWLNSVHAKYMRKARVKKQMEGQHEENKG